MFKTSNPLLKEVQTLYSDGKFDSKKSKANILNVRFIGLAISLVLAISLFLTLILYSEKQSLIVLIIICASTFVVAIASVILAKYLFKLAMLFSFIYAISQGISLGLLSEILATRYHYWILDGVSTINPNSITLITLGISMVVSIVAVQLFYTIDIIKNRSFFFIYLVIVGVVNMIASLIIFYFSTYVSSFNFIPNFLTFFVVSLYMIFLSIVYQETIRRLVDFGIDENYTWTMALGGNIQIIWQFIDFLKIIGNYSS